MKKSELLEIIRTVVKEEVNQALPQILMEVLAEKIVNSDVQPRATSPTPGTAPMQANYRKPQVGLDRPLKSEAKSPEIFSANSKFGKILNETRGGIPTESDDVMVSAHDTIGAIPKEVLSENREVAAVVNAMTKDYSQLLRAMDSKTKSTRRM